MVDYNSSLRDPEHLQYAYSKRRKGLLRRVEWIGVVYEVIEGGKIVLDIGVELNEEDIRKWCKEAISNQPWIEGNPPTPDWYDRRNPS
jgi:hypothetical protein